MPRPTLALASELSAAIGKALGPEWAATDAAIRPATHARFGDYQTSVALVLAKALDRDSRAVAEAIKESFEAGGLCSLVEVAGPGFVNFTLDDEWIAASLRSLRADDRLAVDVATPAETVVVDYSAPNAAKEMHVGHLRSTCIGDALVRTLSFVGHRVIRQNHIGDWGTQFGMLTEHLVDTGWDASAEERIPNLNALYQAAQERFDADPSFADRARQRVVLLQHGDPPTIVMWSKLIAESRRHFRAVYDRLGVCLTDEDIRGESFYNDRLGELADELQASGLAVIDAGALCVFPPGFTGRDGQPLPLIVRKADGGYGYAATDLAALRFRLKDLDASRIAYVVDARQSHHFAMVLAVARMAGWLDRGQRVEHVPFGTVLGPDGRPFRTRSGDTVQLSDLLDEAVERAAAVVLAKNPDLAPEARAEVARAVGIGAIKYADLSSDRVKDYLFDWDRMLAFEGNTAPYLQYAYVRIRSIFRRAEVAEVPDAPISLSRPEERALALALLQFDDVVMSTCDTLQPHRLCTYLFDLAQSFMAFFEACPVLRAETPALRASRLALCDVSARVLHRGLGLLGIETVDQM